jgi:hypothetical protein
MDRFPTIVFEHLPGPVILIEMKRKVVDINRAARKLFNVERTGRDLAISLRNPDILHVGDSVMAEGGVREVEATIADTPPRVITVHVEHIASTEEPDGIAVVLSATDLTPSSGPSTCALILSPTRPLNCGPHCWQSSDFWRPLPVLRRKI